MADGLTAPWSIPHYSHVGVGVLGVGRRPHAATRRAALVPFLSELSDDELEAIGYLLADPLAPRLAVALSSCSRGLRRALAAPLLQLKERRQKAEELCAFMNESVDEDEPVWSCDELRDAALHRLIICGNFYLFIYFKLPDPPDERAKPNNWISELPLPKVLGKVALPT